MSEEVTCRLFGGPDEQQRAPEAPDYSIGNAPHYQTVDETVSLLFRRDVAASSK